MMSHRFYDIGFARTKVNIDETDVYFGQKFGFLDEKSENDIPHNADENLSKMKWMIVSIEWAIENFQDNYSKIFEEVDIVVSNFDYPKCALGIVSYMPAADGKSSVDHHFERIKKFLLVLRDKTN